MKPFGTLDFETDPFYRPDPNKPGRTPKPFAGGIYDGKRYAEEWGPFCARKILHECVRLKYKDFIWYAHNGGKFDFHLFLEYLLEIFAYDQIDILSIGSRIVQIKTPTCIFRDSFSILPKPLKDLAHANKKELEIWKLESDINALSKKDLESFIREKGATLSLRYCEDYGYSPRTIFREEIASYLKQDCKGLHSALAVFFDRFGQELTLASTCFKTLKKQFGMPSVKTNEAYDSKFRRFYFAGRVQFFKLGIIGKRDSNKRFSIYDINSAFPWAMRFRHFFGAEFITSDRPPKNNREQCFYEITCDSMGILPRRNPKNNSIEFPACKHARFYVTGWEYMAALELKAISNVTLHLVHIPLVLRDFSDYINHFYNLKREAEEKGDGAERELQKLFLNGAYGKFSQNAREHRDVCITKLGEEPEPIQIELKNGKTITRKWEKSDEDFERNITFWQMPSYYVGGKPMLFNNVATAASITGCVRAFLARSMAGCTGVLYCDTDSIICEDGSKLSLGSELGQWKLEKECDQIAIGGKKLYAAHDYRGKPPQTNDGEKPKWKEWKTACKGVRLSAEQICEVANGSEMSYSFDAPNYSVFSAPSYTTRRVRRDDLRIKRVA